MKIYVAIATIGRPETVRQIVQWLGTLERQPDGVIVSTVGEADVAGLLEICPTTEILFGAQGLCRQRNLALSSLRDRADVIVFFDDDFVPRRDYLKNVEQYFQNDSHLVGVTGVLLADGIHNSGYGFSHATEIVSDAPRVDKVTEFSIDGLYGCNMVVRTSACAGLEFDERLPLYGWLEDVDFTFRLGRRGKLLKSSSFTGVHMGVKGGRTSGRKLGYSQIANPIYLLQKNSVPRKLAYRLMRQNLVSNLVHSIRPEPHIDRRGRLLGNLKALADHVRGKLNPENITAM